MSQDEIPREKCAELINFLNKNDIETNLTLLVSAIIHTCAKTDDPRGLLSQVVEHISDIEEDSQVDKYFGLVQNKFSNKPKN